MYGAGGQKRVPDDFVREFEVAIPPIDEQGWLGHFLRTEAGKIDGLISEQEKLINLLKATLNKLPASSASRHQR